VQKSALLLGANANRGRGAVARVRGGAGLRSVDEEEASTNVELSHEDETLNKRVSRRADDVRIGA